MPIDSHPRPRARDPHTQRRIAVTMIQYRGAWIRTPGRAKTHICIQARKPGPGPCAHTPLPHFELFSYTCTTTYQHRDPRIPPRRLRLPWGMRIPPALRPGAAGFCRPHSSTAALCCRIPKVAVPLTQHCSAGSITSRTQTLTKRSTTWPVQLLTA